MQKITPEDLERISQKTKEMIHLREGTGRARILVHMGTCGIAAGARTIMSALMEEIEKRNINGVILTTSSCAGLCSREPMITVELKDELPVKYIDLNPEKARMILDKHVLGGEIVTGYALSIGSERVL
ncbi:MAG: (2Fe-2S) ferredoxin domain-containing protein [Candidatus Latescibacteria bacterium]|nr:(2Fe-2S) ferredoxin domain-containing protein [Candidatus Latescibacterota bacterium]MCK5327247.1 (2Fe-2S) ferredoxin domain-containing protein [Candidatus Latescibacterota bacterium]